MRQIHGMGIDLVSSRSMFVKFTIKFIFLLYGIEPGIDPYGFSMYLKV